MWEHFTCHAVVVITIKAVGIARVLIVDGLSIFLVLEVFAIELVGGLLSADASCHELGKGRGRYEAHCEPPHGPWHSPHAFP